MQNALHITRRIKIGFENKWTPERVDGLEWMGYGLVGGWIYRWMDGEMGN